jgi:multidrug efflux system outer membrane protein
VAEFELDLFGRVRNLSEAALQQYFAVAANRRNAQLSLVAETATAWLTYGADAQRLKIADATLKTYEDSLRLAEARHERGGSSALELTQTRTLVETARTDAARLRGQLAQDRNALALLAGGQLDPALLPDSIEPQLLALAPPPAGLPSDVLLQRPDIMAAEHQLLAANANIGAARAAFFPSISLTGSIGSGSSELSNLFDSGTRVELPAEDHPADLPGRQAARQPGHRQCGSRYRAGAVREVDPGGLPRNRRCAGAECQPG